MPSVSRKQYKFFQYLKGNPEAAKEKGISPKVANDYTQGMTKEKWKHLKPYIKKAK